MLAPTPFKTADELGIREADRLGLIEVLSGLEDGTLNQANFFMVSWGECICGWAHKLCKGAFLGFHSRSVVYSATLWRLFNGYPRYPVPQPNQVRVVLRNYLLTGKVNWIDYRRRRPDKPGQAGLAHGARASGDSGRHQEGST